MKKSDIKIKLITDRNTYIRLANEYYAKSDKYGDPNWKYASEWENNAQTLEEILYQGFNYKFEKPTYTGEIIKFDREMWLVNSRFMPEKEEVLNRELKLK